MLKHLLILTLIFVLPSLKSQDATFWSSSLELEEIQQLCDNAVGYESTVIYLPQGEASHNDETLYIPPGVSLIGQGIENTIIENANFVIDSSLKENIGNIFFRITGLFLKTDSHIEILGCNEFRVDNCRIESIGNAAINIKHSKRGLIDHCTLNASNYGVVASNGLNDRYPESFTSNTKSIIGSIEAIYVEDCAFYNYYHGAVSHANSKMVVRFNTFNAGGENPSLPVVAYGPGHINSGDTADYGSRLIECYSNTFYGPDTINNLSAIAISGGSGIIYDNEFIDWQNGVALTLDANASFYDTINYPHDIWIWDNIHNKYSRWDSIAIVTSKMYDHTPLVSEDHIRLDHEYFLRAPDPEIDSFEYEPYSYPHPYSQREVIDTLPSAAADMLHETIKTNCYPNPTQGHLNIIKDDFFRAELFNIQGVKLFTSYSPSIDVSFLPSGHYILKVFDSIGQSSYEKIVVW